MVMKKCIKIKYHNFAEGTNFPILSLAKVSIICMPLKWPTYINLSDASLPLN